MGNPGRNTINQLVPSHSHLELAGTNPKLQCTDSAWDKARLLPESTFSHWNKFSTLLQQSSEPSSLLPGATFQLAWFWMVKVGFGWSWQISFSSGKKYAWVQHWCSELDDLCYIRVEQMRILKVCICLNFQIPGILQPWLGRVLANYKWFLVRGS